MTNRIQLRKGCRPSCKHSNRFLTVACLTTTVLGIAPGCNPLTPRRIDNSKQIVAPELLAANNVPTERGQPRPVIDTAGWVFGIPSKILYWDRRVVNHSVSPETEAVLENYLEENDLKHVKVRINQYRPWDDMRRLTKNRTVAWPWRYSMGAASVLGETILPGRLVGEDHYNPYTATLHIYSDVPSIALRHAARAKDFSRTKYQGTYAALYSLPIVPLYHESIATSDVMAYVESSGDPELQKEANNILYPSYGTHVGGAAGAIVPVITVPAYFISVAGGHIAGRMKSKTIAPEPTTPNEEDVQPAQANDSQTLPR
ncbi:MAG: hypothetical protein WCI02_02535 [Planctomycetota bacterium]